MDLSGQASQARFASYVEALVEVIGHADRAEPLNDYCVGLLMPGERKSVEPMAAIVAPARVSAKHQSLLHLVGQAPWPTRPFCKKSVSWFCLASNDKGGSKPGSSMTPVLRRRARIRSASRDSIWAARQTGQLSSRSYVVDRQSFGEPADRLPALSAGDMGK